jgi:3-dehydroquinate dehydratase type I
VIVLTIPYYNEDQARSQFNRYRKEFMWFEFRLDYSSELNNIPQDLLGRNTIITYRDRSEGGVGRQDLIERNNFYSEVIERKNCFVDLELKLYDTLNLNADNLIVSYHDLSGNLNPSELRAIVQKANTINAKYLKLAVPVNTYSDLTAVKNIILSSNKPVIFAGLGKLNILSRILFNHLGAVGTYIGLNDLPVIKDQLTVDEARLYRIKEITGRTRITGLVGKEQVYNSLGLDFYNILFKERVIDAVYVPFNVSDLSDFRSWLELNINQIYGLSITMPYKKAICEATDSDLPIGNLYLPQTGQVLNTDLAAFKEALLYLQISYEKNILILGSGASAESALITLKDFDHVFISGRNQERGIKLGTIYNRKFVQPAILNSIKIDVLINCTPVGMCGENLLATYNIDLPEKVIDLPYNKTDTPLITSCKKSDFAFVDGVTFWKWQAKLQVEEFNKCL